MGNILTTNSRRRVGVIAGVAGGGVALAAGTAVAALLVFGTGTLTASAAAQSKSLKVTNVKLSNSLVPGGPKVGVKMRVHNPNDFPVKLTKLTGDPTLMNKINGKDVSSFPNFAAMPCHYYLQDGPSNSGEFAIPGTPVVPPGEHREMTVPNLVRQGGEDSRACDLKVTVKVVGEATAGN
jgi:hypothetical protein